MHNPVCSPTSRKPCVLTEIVLIEIVLIEIVLIEKARSEKAERALCFFTVCLKNRHSYFVSKASPPISGMAIMM